MAGEHTLDPEDAGPSWDPRDPRGTDHDDPRTTAIGAVMGILSPDAKTGSDNSRQAIEQAIKDAIKVHEEKQELDLITDGTTSEDAKRLVVRDQARLAQILTALIDQPPTPTHHQEDENQ